METSKPKKLTKDLPMSDVCARSYTLSRLWNWICRIEVAPKLSVPVPRRFTRRDP